MTEIKKILVADDEENIISFLKGFMSFFPNYSPKFFSNGKDLNEELEKGPEGLALVLTDKDMPYITGLKIINDYAKKQGYEEIPFLLMSGGQEVNKIRQEAIHAGAYDFIPKPFNLFDLKNTLQKALGFL